MFGAETQKQHPGDAGRGTGSSTEDSAGLPSTKASAQERAVTGAEWVSCPFLGPITVASS